MGAPGERPSDRTHHAGPAKDTFVTPKSASRSRQRDLADPDNGWAYGQKYSAAGPADKSGSDRNIALVALSVAGGLGIGLGYTPISLSYSL